jgi:hypothetical protein
MISLNERRANGYEKEWNQNEDYQRRNHLDGSFGGLFFGALASGGP